MSRRMSCSMTIDAVRDRTKTVTRRHVDTWTTLKAGDRLTLIEKGMGLPKGAKQVVLAEVEIVDACIDAVGNITARECELEGFPDMHPDEFRRFWLRCHGYAADADLRTPCRRIEWRYL